MIFNGVMAVTLRYFTEFGKLVFQPEQAVGRRVHCCHQVSCQTGHFFEWITWVMDPYRLTQDQPLFDWPCKS